MSSSSVSPGGRSMAPARTAGGITSNSSSTEPIPSAASIRDRSSGVCGPYTMGSALRGECLVCGRVEEVLKLGAVREPDPQHPAGAIWVAVDDLGRREEARVPFENLPGHGREEVADGLHGLHDAERRELREHATGLGQFDEDDVTKLVGGMLGDPDRRNVPLDADPLMLFRVAKIGRDHGPGNLRADAVAAARTWRGPPPGPAAAWVIGPGSRTGAGRPPRRLACRGSPPRASYPSRRRPGRRTPSRSEGRGSATACRR